MKIPLSRLKLFLPLEKTAVQIGDALTLAGIEVEKIEVLSPSFSGIVVGEVLEAQPHPNADQLQIATVSDGKEQFQVVCGASNCRKGIKVAFAKIGAQLTDEKGSFTIKERKLRDVLSQGMICSEKELGLSEEHEGIVELDEEVGTDLASLYEETIFEVALTPNLGHCMSTLGIARELSAIFEIPYEIREEAVEEKGANIDAAVVIEDEVRCHRYACRVVKGVNVEESPSWLKRVLESYGLNSVNNLVDISNLVMVELGQPLHMFDYDRIAGKKIVVTSKTTSPKLKTLDEEEREIASDTLLICDEKEPVAIAGVMGGLESAVTEKTTNILIESAHFIPTAVRKMSRVYGLRTDSAARFSRGVDPEGVVRALNRAVSLAVEVAGGEIAQGVVDQRVAQPEKKAILCRVSRANRMIGIHLSQSEIISLLHRLEIELEKEEGEELYFRVPSYRFDLNEEIDLIEEVARLYGFNNIPIKAPKYYGSTIDHAPAYLFEKEVRDKLLRESLTECVTCDLISPEQIALTEEKSLGKKSTISVLQPSSIDQSVLRPSLLPGLLQVAKYNGDRQIDDLALFEIGRIHYKEGKTMHERATAAILLKGTDIPFHHDPKPRNVDFFDLKGVVENLFDALAIEGYSCTPSHLDNFHPFRQVRVEKNQVLLGVIGEVHPAHCVELGIKGKVYFAELDLPALDKVRTAQVKAKPLPLYPSIERDWTMSVQENLSFQVIEKAKETVESSLLENMTLLDIYRGKNVAEGHKNITLRFVYRATTKTLLTEEAEEEHARIVQGIECALQQFPRA